MRFHIQEFFIDFQRDDNEARTIFLTGMARLLDQVQ